jgi:hypothetical protein
MANDGSVYETREPRYDGKTDHFFNEQGSHDYPHGHVVENPQGGYDYARDVDGNVYIDRQ